MSRFSWQSRGLDILSSSISAYCRTHAKLTLPPMLGQGRGGAFGGLLLSGSDATGMVLAQNVAGFLGPAEEQPLRLRDAHMDSISCWVAKAVRASLNCPVQLLVGCEHVLLPPHKPQSS